VLEFYASTEAGAILVNLRSSKPGSMGRPLPGSAEVRIAGYDIEQRRLAVDAAGFARRVRTGEVGVLLVRVSANDPLSAAPLRGVFTPDDAWALTGDLFRCDEDGDYWRVDGLADVILTAHGPVYTTPIRDALGALPAVDLAVAYGVPARTQREQIAVAAITLRQGRETNAEDIAGALRVLPRPLRPTIVRVVDRIPVTTWFRPMTGPLKEEGIPEPGEGTQAWYLARTGENYRPLTTTARRRLTRSS
jgi:putative long chain acyl-CoA synthase